MRSLVSAGLARTNFLPVHGAIGARAVRRRTGATPPRSGMTPPPHDWTCMSAPELTFLAPPSTGAAPEHDPADDRLFDLSLPRQNGGGSAKANGGLRMTRGAREAAAGMNVSDADIQRCLDAPDEVSPDETTPSRTRFRRGTLVVLSGADGMVLRVERRGGTGRPAPRGPRRG
jgi:hypothetical protein